jgi:hypothetical protein
MIHNLLRRYITRVRRALPSRLDFKRIRNILNILLHQLLLFQIKNAPVTCICTEIVVRDYILVIKNMAIQTKDITPIIII